MGAVAEASAEEPPNDFLAASAFAGPKAGYVFKKDRQGLGYYRDAHRDEAAAKKGVSFAVEAKAAEKAKDEEAAGPVDEASAAMKVAADALFAQGDAAGEEVDYFREYVKPVEKAAAEGAARALSAFCTRLTGITQDDVDKASPLGEVMGRFDRWLTDRGLVTALERGTAVLVAHGGWDLVDQLPKECARKGLALPPYFGAFADLKILFALAYPDHRGTSLKQMLECARMHLTRHVNMT